MQKWVNFTHFSSKTTHISGSITLYLCKNAIVTVHIYTVTVAFYFFFLSLFTQPH